MRGMRLNLGAALLRDHEEPSAQKLAIGTAVHPALQGAQPVDLAFYLAVRPGLAERGDDSAHIGTEAPGAWCRHAGLRSVSQSGRCPAHPWRTIRSARSGSARWRRRAPRSRDGRREVLLFSALVNSGERNVVESHVGEESAFSAPILQASASRNATAARSSTSSGNPSKAARRERNHDQREDVARLGRGRGAGLQENAARRMRGRDHGR